jgi:AcrR family transcriptional regulator
MVFTTPKRADKAREIARAALDQFTQKGFVSARLENIAAAAGIGKSTIYEYFRNKEELFAAAVQEAFEAWFNDIREICAQTEDPMERLERIASEFMECKEHPACSTQRFYFEILMQTIMEGGVFYTRKHFIREVHQKYIRTIADILLAGVSRGQLKPEIARDADKIAITFLSFLDGMALNSLVAQGYIDVNQQVAFFLHNMAPLLRSGHMDPADPILPSIQKVS